MKLTLIYPKWERTYNIYPPYYQQSAAKLQNAAPPGLQVLASLMPKDIELRIINEFYETIPFDEPTDAVGISFFTPQATRAYQIANQFRQRGIPTIAGGIHPSVLPLEAEQFFDTVVIGEGERVWATLLSDLASGRAERRYTGAPVEDFDGLPLPRRDLFDQYGQQFIQPLQTSRGCFVTQCETCVIPGVYGKKIRLKSMDRLHREVAQINEKVLYLVDDHVIWGNSSQANRIFSTLAEHDKYLILFGSPANLTVNPSFLSQANQAGCHVAYISVGFDPQTSRGLFREYDRLVRQLRIIQDAGILPIVSYFLGLDEDEPDLFDQILTFNRDARIEAVDYALYCPYPGTASFRRYQKAGRLLHTDWDKYNYLHPVYHPARMSVETLMGGFNQLWKFFFDEYPDMASHSPFYRETLNRLMQHISPPPL